VIIQGLLLTDPAAPPEPGWIRCEEGRIAELEHGAPPERPTVGSPSHVVSPGFIDAHIHLPQIDAAGCDGMELLEWLQKVVFPAESWWGRGGALRDVANALHRMTREGTLGFAGYLTSHAEGSAEALRALAGGLGLPRLRFAAGRVAMDRRAPDDLTAEDRHRAALSPSPPPILAPPPAGARGEVSANPRFAITCTGELLAEIGWAVRDADREILVQTHLCETRPEIELVRELFPEDPHYTGVYDRFGLLTPRTLLAHGVHLTPPEWELIRERGSVVVHCPTANLFLRAGVFDFAAARDHGVRLALGSDVAGGPDIAMPRVARAMIDSAKARELLTGTPQPVPTPAEAWRLITRGNAEAIGWDDAGRLEPGATADLLVLRPPDAWMDEHLIGRMLYGWAHEMIDARVIDGRIVDAARV
jgi:guanine deaminase